MANKIIERIIEPSKILVGSTFTLKIKTIRYMTCAEMKTITCLAAQEYSCGEVRGL